MRENRLRFGHVTKREKSEAVRMVMGKNVDGSRGKPKKRCLDAINSDMRTASVCR